mgnify:CR=1 FL=1
MNYKKKSKMWNTYHIPERVLKWYSNMDYYKTRPILVISDSSSLENKCLVVELSTHDALNPYRLQWYNFYSKKDQRMKTSYILPNRIHTVSRNYLRDVYKSHNKKYRSLSIELKQQIYDFIRNLLNEKS